MTSNHPEQNGKRGSALLMVLLAGVLIILIGAGMLFFYQKQVERRMKLEFDIHRRLAAKSGFALVQYSGFTGTGTYVYAVASNRPVILVTVGEALPIYTEDFSAGSLTANWRAENDGDCEVDLYEGQFKFSTASTNIGQRNELVFAGTNDVAWNNYPFGLCYYMSFDDTSLPPTNWAGYVYVGASNAWNQMFITNTAASLAVFGMCIDDDNNNRRLELYEHTTNSIGAPINSFPAVATLPSKGRMFVRTELYMDDNHMALGMQAGEDTTFAYEEAPVLSEIFSDASNVVMGLGGFNLAVATNAETVLKLYNFEVSNPFEYEIYLSWTNRNRFLGSTGIFTNVLATVVDVTPNDFDKRKYYFFDSFETVVP